MCDILIVGVTSDELVSYKGKQSVIPYEERAEIIRNIKCVDFVVKQEDMDKMKMWERLKFDIMFVGDDWKGTAK
jgi:glycerol-3-phosphate cytidylyltransferase-like family protein